MERRLRRFAPIIITVSLISALDVGCGRDEYGERKDAPQEQDLKKRRNKHKEMNREDRLFWLDKAARTLRNGRGLGPEDDEEALLALGEKEALDWLMRDESFAESVFHFNLYFLGFRESESDFDPDLDSLAKQFPSAFSSAKEVAQGGHYYALLNYSQSMVPLEKTYETDEYINETRADIFSTLSVLKKSYEEGDLGKFCEVFSSSNLMARVNGFGFELGLHIQSSDDWLGPVFGYCSGKVASLDGHFDALKVNFKNLMDLFLLTNEDRYSPTKFSELKFADPKKYKLPATAFTTDGFWFQMTNASTNYNRSRGAYILGRYFCDDLTPINVETPDDHAGDRHASDPACQSCHYKLDPIAGFFKNHGIFGTDFSGQDTIRFDDGAVASREEYEKAWQSKSRKRKWDIGYVRSVNDDSLNSYGNSMEELGEILAGAPEVKQCVVKRMFEYFVGTGQAVDKGYLESLSEELIEVRPEHSARAFKKVLANLVTSDVFMTRDPISTKCYDYAPGVDGAGRPPCQIAHILNKNCTNCHGDNAPAGGLNLAGWTKLSDGTLSFPHRDDSGEQVYWKVTFERLLRSLESRDEAVRMPLNQHMSAQDREEIYLWVNRVLNEGL